jgi:hypothetical protein
MISNNAVPLGGFNTRRRAHAHRLHQARPLAASESAPPQRIWRRVARPDEGEPR